MLKADLHVHSQYSPDSTTSLDSIINHCLMNKINCIALTDHNTIAGAIKLKTIAPFFVIVGEEIMTDSGEIMGLFLSEEIPPNLSAEETISKIKMQGGLVCIPHPFDTYFRPSAIKRDVLHSILKSVDIIEVLNSHTVIGPEPSKLRRWANNQGLLVSAGSDAHIANEIGNAYIEMPEFTSIDEFVKSLSQGIIKGRKSSPWDRITVGINKLTRRFKK